MSKRSNARYDFSMTDCLIIPLNDDLTQPEVDNIIGGVGPFDFTDAAVITAVTLNIKVDTGTTEELTIDLSGSTLTAVTVAELFAAINTASPTDITASAEADTGRLKLVYDGADDPTYVQVWGEAATIGLIGQGKGIRIAYSDTMQSVSDTPDLKDEETFTTTDAKGKDTEVKSDGYRKGTGGTLTDTAMDYFMRSVVEGGTYDETKVDYEVPTSDTAQNYFKVEIYAGRYSMGTNKEADLVGYVKTEVFSCKGTFGDRTRERGFTNAVYNYSATSPKDSDGNITADSKETVLSTSAYDTLSLSDLVTY